MHFVVNASPPKPLDVAASNFASDRSYEVVGTLATSYVTLPKG